MNWHQTPLPVHDGIGVIIHQDVKASDLIRANSCLGYQNVIYLFRLVHITVGMTTEDHVHAPFWFQDRRELFVRVKTDMGQ